VLLRHFVAAWLLLQFILTRRQSIKDKIESIQSNDFYWRQ